MPRIAFTVSPCVCTNLNVSPIPTGLKSHQLSNRELLCPASKVSCPTPIPTHCLFCPLASSPHPTPSLAPSPHPLPHALPHPLTSPPHLTPTSPPHLTSSPHPLTSPHPSLLEKANSSLSAVTPHTLLQKKEQCHSLLENRELKLSEHV